MNLNHGLRNFFGYLRDSFRSNELTNQNKIRILFLAFLVINGAALIFATDIAQKLLDGTNYDALISAMTSFLNNTSLFTSQNSDQILNTFYSSIAPYTSVFIDIFAYAALNYLPYFFLSLISLLYCRDLMIHHLQNKGSGLISFQNVFWKAFLFQILILPIIFFSINGSNYISMFVFPFANSIYWFFVFSIFDLKSEAQSFGKAFGTAFKIYKTRFIQLILLVALYQMLSTLVIFGSKMFFDTFSKPYLTASIQAFLLAIFQFVGIRFLFYIYKDIKYPELLLEKEKEDEKYDD
ncbi:MAG: hypothetical protein WCQ41_04440 [Bacillota bacterium]